LEDAEASSFNDQMDDQESSPGNAEEDNFNE